jgi:hypothetical protein
MTCGTYGEKKNAYKVLAGKSEGNRPLGKPRRWWENNIKIDLREIGWGGMDWIHLVQEREHWRALMNMLMSLRVS